MSSAAFNVYEWPKPGSNPLTLEISFPGAKCGRLEALLKKMKSINIRRICFTTVNFAMMKACFCELSLQHLALAFFRLIIN